MKVEKIPPVKCIKCNGTKVNTFKKFIRCDDCQTLTEIKTGKVKKIDRDWKSHKGHIPKETDDYESRG